MPAVEYPVMTNRDWVITCSCLGNKVAEVKLAIRLESLPLELKRARDLERAFAMAQSLGANAVEIDARE